MSRTLSTTELQAMSIADLQKELSELQSVIAKLKLTIALRKEKNTASLPVAKKQFAKLSTVYTQKQKELLQSAATTSKVSVRSSHSK